MIAASVASLTPTELALVIAGVGAVNIIVTAVLAAAFGRWAQATDRRRDNYSAAVSILFAWAEYPYRIRRRTSDDSGELARLANLGHDLQESLRCHQTWVITESPRVAKLYSEVVTSISARTAQAAKDAWNHPPVSAAGDMNLNGWGPVDSVADIGRLQDAIATRFGWGRMVRRR
jgi:hypothetical protein